MVQWLGTKGYLCVMDYTVLIMKQTLADQHKHPFGYTYERPEKLDLSNLTTAELNQLYLQAQEIEARIQTMLSQRG